MKKTIFLIIVLLLLDVSMKMYFGTDILYVFYSLGVGYLTYVFVHFLTKKFAKQGQLFTVWNLLVIGVLATAITNAEGTGSTELLHLYLFSGISYLAALLVNVYRRLHDKEMPSIVS